MVKITEVPEYAAKRRGLFANTPSKDTLPAAQVELGLRKPRRRSLMEM